VDLSPATKLFQNPAAPRQFEGLRERGNSHHESNLMRSSEKTLVAIATFNEIHTLPRLVEEIQRHLPAAGLLVIDDNSPDGTGRWCEEKASADPRVACLHREGKLGLGTALVTAMRYAAERRDRYDCLVTMDADFSHPPEMLCQLVAAMEPADGPQVDVAIGSRYIAGGRIEGWPWARHFLSRSVNLVARWLLGLSPRDCSSGFRCYRTELLARTDFEGVLSRGYSFEEEVLWRLKRSGARFAEVPIHFVNRRHGASKIDVKELLASAAILLRLAMTNLLGR
jgi:dolichol-phosphate mannosyltransferase